MINDILLLEDDNAVIAGEVTIVDFRDVTKSHLLALDPLLAKKLAALHEEGSPVKQKVIHYVHTPPGFEVVFNVFKSIMQSRNPNIENHPTEAFLHPTSYATLFDHIPQSVLPAEFGGTCPLQTIIDYWDNKLLAYRDFFIQDAAFGTNETQRMAAYRHQHVDFLMPNYD